jgi:superfamily II DNA or RNA helicase
MSNFKINTLDTSVSSGDESSPRCLDSRTLTARERNNLSRQRCYQRERVEAQWKEFEYFSYEWYRSNFDNSKVFLWDFIPEEKLIDSGYLLDLSKHRKTRLDHKLNPVRDCGLDLLVEEYNEKNQVIYHGGQCKHYHGTVSGQDLGYFPLKTMLLQKKNPESLGLLFTSGEITSELNQTFEMLDSFRHFRLPFGHNSEEAPRKKNTKSKESVFDETTASRRDYQLDVKKQALDHFHQTKKSCVVINITCALGKTIIAADILKELSPLLIVAMAPLKSELDNLIERLPPFFPKYKLFMFDSDYCTDISLCEQTILDCQKRKQGLILFITYKSVRDILMPYLSIKQDNPDELQDHYETIEETIQYSSNLDIESKTESFTSDSKLYSILQHATLFADEVHNIPINATRLHQFVNLFNRSICCTATLPKSFHTYIHYTLCINKYDFNYALQHNYVVDYRIMIPTLFTKEDYNYVPQECKDLLSYDQLYHQAMFLMNGMLFTGSRRCIVYLSTKDECKKFNEVWTQIAKLFHGVHTWTGRINDDITAKKRQQVLELFELEDPIHQQQKAISLKVVTCCSCLNQAINVIRCDSVFITKIGPQANQIVMYQRFNRSARLDTKNPNKMNHCFMWCDEDYSSLQSLVTRLKFSLQDPNFDDKLKIISRHYDEQLNPSIITQTKQYQQLINELVGKWIPVEERWELKYNQLVNFINFHSKFPSHTDNKVLNQWIQEQKYNYKNKTILLERLTKLRCLDLWNKWEEISEIKPKIVTLPWEEQFNKVKSYYDIHHKFPVSTDKENGGSWVHVQKKDFKSGKLSLLQINSLRSLEIWSVWEKDPWIQKFERVKEYYESNRDPDLEPTDFSHNDWWLDCKKNFKNNKLKASRLELLRTFSQWTDWESKNKTKEKKQFTPWDESFKLLQTYVQEHNSFPLSTKPECVWLNGQKERFKEDKLTQEQLQMLNQLAPWVEWTSQGGVKTKQVRHTWEENYALLQEYVRVHGKFPLKKEKSTLSYWVQELKKDYNKGVIKQDRLRLLQQFEEWIKWTRKQDEKRQSATNENDSE